MVRGGWRALLGLRLRCVWLIWVAAAVQALRHADPSWAAPLLHPLDGLWPVLATWLLAVGFAAVNLWALPARSRPGTLLAAVGFTVNSLAIAVNGGMPFSVPGARVAGFSEAEIATPIVGHPPITTDSALIMFADVIPLPGLHRVISIGDILLLAGLVWLLAAIAPPGGNRREAVARTAPLDSVVAVEGGVTT
jgi:hypothetical protein